MEWRMKAGLISLGPAHPAPSLALIPSLDSKAKERKSTKERIKYLFMISILPSSPPPPPPSSSASASSFSFPSLPPSLPSFLPPSHSFVEKDESFVRAKPREGKWT